MKTIKSTDGNYIEFDLELKIETKMAILCSDGTCEVWIPKSQLEDDIERLANGLVRIIIPEWLAQEKELI